MSMPKADKIPVSKLKRSAITGLVVAKIGIKHVGYKTRKIFSKSKNDQQLKQGHEEDIGKLIFTALSQLKGTALKISQLLSMEADLLPPTIRNQLKDACYQVKPINKALVRKQIVNEFGITPKALFKSFDMKAFAAASIGQVHKATTKDNLDVAVKIQYPGIGSTIESDLKIIESLFSMLSRTSDLMPHKDVLTIMIGEMRDRLAEEVDYCNEEINQQWFKNNLKLEKIRIPEVLSDYSSKRVITSEFLNGKHLNEWLANIPEQAEKNQVGQLLFDHFWYSVFKLNRINADPHPGNFLFLANGDLGILDFGCVRSLDKDFTQHCARLIPSLVDVFYNNGSIDQLRTVYQSLKLISQEVDEDEFARDIYPYIKRFSDWFAEAYATEYFDFSNKKPCPGRPDQNSKQVVTAALNPPLFAAEYRPQIAF